MTDPQAAYAAFASALARYRSAVARRALTANHLDRAERLELDERVWAANETLTTAQTQLELALGFRTVRRAS